MTRPRRTLATSCALALACLAALSVGSPGASSASSSGAWSFLSSPVTPPKLTVTTNHLGATCCIFLAPIRNFSHSGSMQGEYGPEIIDSQGNPVWALPTPPDEAAMNLRTQTYRGQQVLTLWIGKITGQGIGQGADYILDSHYNIVAIVRAADGLSADHHEFLIEGNDAYLIAYRTVHMDLHRFGGSTHGEVADSIIQEINIRTGKLVWHWDPLHHVSLSESYARPSGPWDWFHLNSIALGPGGDVLISARNTWAVYDVRKKDGRVYYRLGGRRSSFSAGRRARFAWEHDAQFVNGNDHLISLFDDEAAPAEETQSRGIVLVLDKRRHSVALVRQWRHKHPPVLSGSQGNVELSNGAAFIGWGQAPYVSEFTKRGKLVFDAIFPGPDQSYRAFIGPWTGQPTTPPSVAARASGNATTVYASWNGATTVASWQLLSGQSAAPLGASGSPVARTGFETAIGTGDPGPYFAVQARDSSGRVLATSAAVHR